MTDGSEVVDSHPDFISGGGFTEHSLFVAGLQSKTGFVTALPTGPQHSQSKKKKAKAKAKRSARTKEMLAPPQPAQDPAGVKEDLEVLEDVLPGRPVSDDCPAFLHCCGANDDREDDRCLSNASKGKRCRKKRVVGNYCRQHSLEWSDCDKKNKVWESVSECFAQAVEA